MIPSWDQIQRAAYERWERRGWHHGHDHEDWAAAEMDLRFAMNYETVVEEPFGDGPRRVVGNDRRRRCRFCEQAPPRSKFSAVRPVVPEFVGNTALFTCEVCDECHKQFAETIDEDFARFYASLESLRNEGHFGHSQAPTSVPIGAYKGLIRMALALVPEGDLSAFTDTLEWVSNPDHEFDGNLFRGLDCLVYRAHVPFGKGWASLARRTDEEAPHPYMLFYIAAGRMVMQVHLPLCAHDQDLEGAQIRLPERSFSTGWGPDLRASSRLVLPIRPTENPHRRRIRLFA